MSLKDGMIGMNTFNSKEKTGKNFLFVFNLLLYFCQLKKGALLG